jgi:hypothetical protein
MRTWGAVGVVLILAGMVVALASLGSQCYATTIPGVVPSGPSCDETFVIAAGGVLSASFGVILAVRRPRNSVRQHERTSLAGMVVLYVATGLRQKLCRQSGDWVQAGYKLNSPRITCTQCPPTRTSTGLPSRRVALA